MKIPEINRNQCEGKGECVRVCPYGVFEIAVLDENTRKNLTLRGKMKAFFQGYRQASVKYPDRCQSCGKCEDECPESAITLVKK